VVVSAVPSILVPYDGKFFHPAEDFRRIFVRILDRKIDNRNYFVFSVKFIFPESQEKPSDITFSDRLGSVCRRQEPGTGRALCLVAPCWLQTRASQTWSEAE
jgi:hypothetical protein